MPEEVKKCYEKAARAIAELPEKKKDLASMLTEAYANGLSTGQAIAKEEQRKEAES